MKREWFEPGNSENNLSPFEREYYLAHTNDTAESISAAFRALLAGDEQSVDTQRSIAAALANGQLSLQDEITRLRAELARLKNECSDQQSYVLDLESAIARKDTRIKVLEVANDSLTQYSSNLTAERDALQARIGAGVRAWHNWKQECGSLWLWAFPGATASQAWSDVCDALDADYVVYPIAEVDERTGKEQRFTNPERGIRFWMDDKNLLHDERRTTPGTRADRRQA